MEVKQKMWKSQKRELRMTVEMAIEVMKHAGENMTSQNTWILQAIAEKLIRERKAQK